MFPVGDDDSQRRTTPVVTFVLIGLNVLVFLVELSGGDQFITEWAFVPERFSAHPAANIATVFSAMFMHGGWLHLGGNMLFLFVFGDNVERALGHTKYLAFYLVCGVVAAYAQILSGPESVIPSLGASGAISGALAAYLVFFPQNRVKVLVGMRFVTEVPALLMIGLWALLQFVSGIGSIAVTDQTGGVAYWAHIGGFIAGVILAFLLRPFSNIGPRARIAV